MNGLGRDSIGIHGRGLGVKFGLQGFMFNCFIGWLEDDLRKKFYGLAEELRLEVESEFSDFSFDTHEEFASERIYQLVDFIFGVFSSSIESSMSSKTSS